MIRNHVRNEEQETDVGVNEPLALTGHFSGHLNLGPRQRPHRPL
jgi:hypothetical protein